MSLYADDMLLNLQDSGPSLSDAFAPIQEFGDFSRFCIIWSKSSLFPIDDVPSIPASCPIPLSRSFRYLGVQI